MRERSGIEIRHDRRGVQRRRQSDRRPSGGGFAVEGVHFDHIGAAGERVHLGPAQIEPIQSDAVSEISCAVDCAADVQKEIRRAVVDEADRVGDVKIRDAVRIVEIEGVFEIDPFADDDVRNGERRHLRRRIRIESDGDIGAPQYAVGRGDGEQIGFAAFVAGVDRQLRELGRRQNPLREEVGRAVGDAVEIQHRVRRRRRLDAVMRRHIIDIRIREGNEVREVARRRPHHQ